MNNYSFDPRRVPSSNDPRASHTRSPFVIPQVSGYGDNFARCRTWTVYFSSMAKSTEASTKRIFPTIFANNRSHDPVPEFKWCIASEFANNRSHDPVPEFKWCNEESSSNSKQPKPLLKLLLLRSWNKRESTAINIRITYLQASSFPAIVHVIARITRIKFPEKRIELCCGNAEIN
ncbi:hypothetical protein OS493_016151 [Desmophyllum pertusum]|uniref:Uncharacterized protein n=1 Tax=Desmophyllum pertusum TaxID=174260 RepID=A0A9X0A1Q7_9CNID|nr:hypothetical protein OS493_016151 [Desmophyllum pertusum]